MPRKAQPAARSTRRSSRRASPNQRAVESPSTPPAPPPPKRARTSLAPDTWAEPALRAPAPSFEEQGLQRHPLFQTMEPLGKAPEGKRLTLKLNFKRSKSPSGAEDSAKGASPRRWAGAKRARDEDDTEGEGGDGEAAAAADSEVEATASPAAKPATLLQNSSARHLPSPTTPITRHLSAAPQTPSNPSVMDRAMSFIAERAKASGDEAVADAIQRVYASRGDDPKIARVLDAVKQRNPSEKHLKRFARLLRRARDTIDDERRAEAAKSAGSKKRTKSAPAQPSPTPNNPTAAKTAAPSLMPSALPDTNSSTQTRRRAALPAASRRVSKAAARTNDASPTPNAVLPAVSRATERANDASTTPNTNGDVQTGTQTRARATRATRATQQQQPEPSPKQPVLQALPAPAVRETRARKRGDSTSSDLSSVDEQIVKEGLPSHGAGSKRSAANAGFVEDPEIAARRKELEDELKERRKEWEKDYPISDMRGPIQPSSQRRRAPAQSSTVNGRSTRATAGNRAASPDIVAIDTPMPSPSLTNGRSSRTTGATDRNPKSRAGARTKHS
jgi:hypothetical protein